MLSDTGEGAGEAVVREREASGGVPFFPVEIFDCCWGWSLLG